MFQKDHRQDADATGRHSLMIPFKNMKNHILLPLLGVLTLLPCLQADPLKELSGAGDPAYFKRYEGSVLFRYADKKYDAFVLPLGLASEKETFNDSLTIEGGIQKRTYAVPGKRSALEVYRNYRKELDAAGWTTLWEGRGPKDLGFWFSYYWDDIGDGSSYNQYFSYSPESMIYWAGKIEKPDGVYHAALTITEYRDGMTVFALEKGQVIVQVNTVKVAAMDEKMVVVKAAEMDDSLKSAGRVALYGIYFDTNKAEVKAESGPTLDQIATLLKEDPAMKLIVTGHTDNVGGFEFNRDLSTRRAQAVVAELTAKHGIAPDRLFPFGVSFASPVASNDSEPGRAKNRRVELVKM